MTLALCKIEIGEVWKEIFTILVELVVINMIS